MSVALSRGLPWSLVTVLFLGLSLAGCGGGGGGSSSGSGDAATASTGSVALLLTDNPIDLDTVSEINATIAKAELIGDDDNRVTIFSGPPVTKNLLALRNGSVPLAFSDDVPIGTYCKIRLTLTRPDDAPMGEGLEVVFVDPATETAYPNVPGNGKFDCVVQGCFDVYPGVTVQLMADLDMEKSLLLVEAGKSGRINFRPVGFVKALTEDFTGRLIRLDGEIKVIIDNGNEVLLCNALPMHRDDDHDGDDDDYDSDDEDRRGCVTLNLDRGSTAVFNNLNDQGGVAVPVPAILRADGQPATVVGKLVLNPESPEDVEVPEGHLPPPGSCKIWYPDRDDGQQPRPASCEDLEDEVPAGAVMVDHAGEIEIDRRSWLSIDALVVELGEFIEELAGSVDSGASDMRFTMNVNPDQGIEVENPLQVQLQQSDPEQVINGTKILTNEGDELTFEVLTPGTGVMVDGVLVEGDPTFLRSALVIVGDLAEDTQRLSGTVTRATEDSSFLVVTEEPACGLTDVVVATDSDTKRFTVTVTETTATSSEGASIEPGDVVDVYGSCQGDGSFAAGSIIEIDDQRGP
jgi:hypothetical protein